jgi:hypothetical protein
MLPVKMKIGSEVHKELFCRSFIDSHWAYEPEQLPWPELDELYLERLRRIPFWEEALATELQAGVAVTACAEAQDDPLLRTAIALQAEEESRHARIIGYLIQHYDIEVQEPHIEAVGANPEKAFSHFGYGECLDSFGAFGLFELARQGAYLPTPFFQIFDRVLDEEARHIVFFVNWAAYRQVKRGRGAKILRGASSLWNYGKALRHLLGIIRDANNENESFTTTGAATFVDDLSLSSFLQTCLQENERRMARFDKRLLQPRLLPTIAKIALATGKLISQRRPRKTVGES